MTIDIKNAVKDGKRVRFAYYFDGDLWYQTEDKELFPVPIVDIGNATFLNEDKAILFMRYMRKWNESLADLNRKRRALNEYGKDDSFKAMYENKSEY